MSSRRVAVLLVVGIASLGDADDVLEPGATATGVVDEQSPVVATESLDSLGLTEDTRGRNHPVQVRVDGTYTIDLAAYLHDAYLVLRDESGAVVAEDDDGGFGTHARLVVELQAGRRYEVVACALHGGTGPYELTFVDGRPRQLSREELAAAGVADAMGRVQATARVHGELSVEMTQALDVLANTLYSLGRFADAERVWEQALAIQEREEVGGPDDPEVAELLINIAATRKRQQQYHGVRERLERALAIQERSLGADHIRASTTLNHLSDLALILGDLEAARRHAERSLAIREAKLGLDHPDLATTLDLLARIVRGLGDGDAAIAAMEGVLRIREKTLGPKHPLVAVTLSHLADAKQLAGDLGAARELLERSIAIRAESLPPDHPDLGAGLNNLAVLLRYMGEYDESRTTFERALAIRERAFGPRSPYVGSTLNNMAMLLRDQGDLGGARSLFERSLEITEESQGPLHPNVAGTLNNLGTLLWELGDEAGARAALERSLAIAEAALGPENPNTATTMSNLGALLGHLGELERAMELAEGALAIHERMWGPDHVEVAFDLMKVGDLAWASGDGDRAIELYRRSHAAQRALYGAAHPYAVLTKTRAALASADTGDLVGAWEIIREAETERTEHVEQSLSRMTESEGFLYLARIRTQLELQLSLAHHIDVPGAMRDAYETLVDWKGRVGRLMIRGREQVLADLGGDNERLVEELRDVQSRLSRLALADTDGGEDLAALRDRRDALDRRLRRGATESTSDDSTSFEELRAVLPKGSAVVDLFSHRLFFAHAESGRERHRVLHVWSPSHLTAWITRPDFDEPVRVDLGPIAPIGEAAAAYLEDLTAGAADARDDSDAALRRWLWDPLAPHLTGVDTVFVSPDGVAATVPFETLRDDDGRYLVEDRAFVYAGDAGTLAHLAREAPRRARTSPSLLAIGGVDYDRRGGDDVDDGEPSRVLAAADGAPVEPTAARPGRYKRRLRGGLLSTWRPLPATAVESRAVSDLHEEVAPGDERRLVLQGGAATELRLRDELTRYDVIHLATHGFFQPEGFPSMWEAALDATESEDPYKREITERVVGMHPGLLSGIVCAGANLEPADDTDDGYLTAEELGWLDLSNAELVVLSACETGLGKAQAGEGLLGLRRAFRTAGAATVISSLWSVDDRSTSRLMRSFYTKLWRDGMGRHAALRAAQLEMLRENRDADGDARPSTWGAFVLDGEWR